MIHFLQLSYTDGNVKLLGDDEGKLGEEVFSCPRNEKETAVPVRFTAVWLVLSENLTLRCWNQHLKEKHSAQHYHSIDT